jgi:alkaline phosphatase D
MKIVFASCFDALEDPNKDVWACALEQNPDALLLLGDIIYMDYFPHLGQSRRWSTKQFADEMYRRYKAQWSVASFRELINSVNHIGITWDDHDFAWNGSCGAGTGEKTGVPSDKRLT